MPALKVWVANERLTSTDLNATFASVDNPEGVVASAAGTSGAPAPITLNAVVEGKASYLAGGRIVTPRAGLYLIHGVFALSGTVTSGMHVFRIVGPNVDLGFWNGGAAAAHGFSTLLLLASGVQLTGQYTPPSGTPTITITRIGFLFLGTGYAP